MIRTSFAIAAVAAVAVVVAQPAGAAAAHLAVTGTAPFTIRGSHFKPHEHVRISVTTSAGAGARSLVAAQTGGFVARFATITLGTCASYTVRAIGTLGSRATVRVVAECANGPTQ